MKKHIFREYDIRGIVGKEFDISESYEMAKSIISYFLQQNPNLSKISVAMDGRKHSDKIKKFVLKAITEMGLDAIDLGLCPTPTFYFSLFTLESNSGIMITASHNPGEYNGMKICLEKKSVYGSQIQQIRQMYETKNFHENKNKTTGMVIKKEIIPQYIDWLYNNFKHLENCSINAIIDCGNGTAGSVLPDLIKKMKWKNVKLLFQEIDGDFPNHQADPTTLKNMKDVKKILEKEPDTQLGLGLDGDCDRMSPMTKNGYLVPGDQLLAVYSKKVLRDNPNATIVFDIKASSSLIELLKSWGAKDLICPSGHSLVKQAMLDNNAKLAGELSCHFFFNDRYFGYDDGIYSILRLFEIINETKQSLEQLISIFPQKYRSAEIRISCQQKDKQKVIGAVKEIFAKNKNSKLLTIDGIRAQTGDSWGLIRASNTQDVVCLRFESDTKKGFEKIKSDFYSAIKPHFNHNKLKKEMGI